MADFRPYFGKSPYEELVFARTQCQKSWARKLSTAHIYVWRRSVIHFVVLTYSRNTAQQVWFTRATNPAAGFDFCVPPWYVSSPHTIGQLVGIFTLQSSPTSWSAFLYATAWGRSRKRWCDLTVCLILATQALTATLLGRVDSDVCCCRHRHLLPFLLYETTSPAQHHLTINKFL